MTDLLLGAALGLIICLLSYKARFLTLSGAIAAFVLAVIVFGFGGLKWSVPLLVFFFSSSLLSKIRKKINPEMELYFDKTGNRDYMQVISNGGLGGVLILVNLISPNEMLYLIYLSIFASACADTWATEIGTLRKTNTYNILSLKKIDQGVSGGISVSGSLGALLGAAVISFSSFTWMPVPKLVLFFVVMICGFCGSFIDSLLGASVQLRYKCTVCGKFTERTIHCGHDAGYFKGIKWVSNDVVNLVSGLAGGLLNWIIIEILLKTL